MKTVFVCFALIVVFCNILGSDAQLILRCGKTENSNCWFFETRKHKICAAIKAFKTCASDSYCQYHDMYREIVNNATQTATNMGVDCREYGRECRDGEIKCYEEERCMLNKRRCDGTKDCLDGSDERYCKLGTGEIVGIALGGVAFVCLVVMYICCIKRFNKIIAARRQQMKAANESASKTALANDFDSKYSQPLSYANGSASKTAMANDFDSKYSQPLSYGTRY